MCGLTLSCFIAVSQEDDEDDQSDDEDEDDDKDSDDLDSNDDDDDGDDDADDDDDDDEKDVHEHRHKKRRSHKKSRHEEEDDDDDDDNAVSKHKVPRKNEAVNNDNTIRKHEVQRKNGTSLKHKGVEDEYNRAHHLGESEKKDVAPMANVNDESFDNGVISGTGSEISFVSKHGPAKFYWMKHGNSGSEKSMQM